MIKNILIDKNKNEKPKINLTVQRVEPSVWTSLSFDKHHYLTSALNKSCKCLLFSWDGVPVGFVGLLNSPRKGMPWGHSISRVVVLPDFQGMGLSSQIINFCGGILKSMGDDWSLYLKTIHEKMGEYMTRSDKWSPTSYNGKVRSKESTESEGKRYQNRLQRKSFCFKYVGDAIYGYEELLKPIKELRENKKNPKNAVQLTIFD